MLNVFLVTRTAKGRRRDRHGERVLQFFDRDGAVVRFQRRGPKFDDSHVCRKLCHSGEQLPDGGSVLIFGNDGEGESPARRRGKSLRRRSPGPEG